MNPIVLVPIAVAAVAAQAAPAARGQLELWSFPAEGSEGQLRAAAPIGDVGRWATPADFPASAFPSASQQTGFAIRVAVDAAGRVVGCKAEPMFRETDVSMAPRACALIRERGRFRHALDAAGRPVAGEAMVSIWFASADARYVGPPPAPPAPPPGGFGTTRPVPRDAALLRLPPDRAHFPVDRARVLVDVDAKGRVARCRIYDTTGSDAGDLAVCTRLAAARFEPARSGGRKLAWPRLLLTLTR